MNLAFFVGLFGTQSPRKGSLVLADFMHKVRNTENHKSHIVLFLKNGGDRSGGLQKLPSPKIAKKYQKFYPLKCVFFLECKRTNGHQTFSKKRM